MASLKKNLSVVSKHEAFYTGGQIQITKDGGHMFCPCDWRIQVLQLSTGKVTKSFGQEEEPISCFCLSPDDKYVIVATRQLLFRQWDWETDVVTRSWRAIHVSSVSCMTFDMTSTLLASGSSDSTVKVWDIVEQYCTHNFKGHQGVISIARFRPNPSRLQLVTSADDYKVRVWDLNTSECVAIVDGHYSLLTSLTFSDDAKVMYTGGRDSVIGVWDMEALTLKKTIPVFETVESVMLLRTDRDYSDIDLPKMDCPHVLVAGGQGTMRLFNTQSGRCVHTRTVAKVPKNVDEGEQIVTQAFRHDALNSVVVVTYDNNISFHSDTSLSIHKQLSGSTSEVLDMQFIGEKESHLVVVSNSEKIKVFDISQWSCVIVEGHTDIILAVDVYQQHDLVVTSSKDCTTRLWQFIPDTGGLVCLAVARGHVQPVGTVAFSRKSASFLVTGSRDMTVKVWPLPSTLDTEEVTELTCRGTELAHDKDINCVVVSPNDKLIATASQDKTAKLWKTSDLTLMGVFRGHSRGIWCVQFSPVDQCLATSSTDGSVRIWSLSDFSCVKTFEGHDASVLKVLFISRGMQLLSVGSDGLLKLWTIKTNECVKTFDEHEAKVWCVACSKDEERVVTGDAESTVIVWKDVSEQEEEQSLLEQEQLMLQQQELSNLIKDKRYLKAIGLTITLEQPYRLLGILKEIMFESGDKTKLEQTLSKLRPDQIDAVLRFSQTWNTNSKHCHVTQTVLRVILQSLPPDDIVKLPNIKSTIEGMLPYTERHFQRLSRLYQQSRFVEYTWQCMRMVSMETPQTVDTSTPMVMELQSNSDASSSEDSDIDNPAEKHLKQDKDATSTSAEEKHSKSRKRNKKKGRKSISKQLKTESGEEVTSVTTVQHTKIKTPQSKSTAKSRRRTNSEESAQVPSDKENMDALKRGAGGKVKRKVTELQSPSAKVAKVEKAKPNTKPVASTNISKSPVKGSAKRRKRRKQKHQG